jgi:hypothetical protein
MFENWQKNNWSLGIHVLKLEVWNNNNDYLISEFQIYINLTIGDPFANLFLKEKVFWSINPSQALGYPDNLFCTISSGYGQGSIVLDMGENEEIIDDIGNDFTIIAAGGYYRISVSQDHNNFINLGVEIGNVSIDINKLNNQRFRYLKIENFNGTNVLLDAIVAIHYNISTWDDVLPYANAPNNFIVFSYLKSFRVNFTVSESNPWNYKIFVNNTLVVSNFWLGENISFNYEWSQIGFYNITLILFDVVGNSFESSVFVQIIEEKTLKHNNYTLLIIELFLVSLIIIISTKSFLKKKKIHIF